MMDPTVIIKLPSIVTGCLKSVQWNSRIELLNKHCSALKEGITFEQSEKQVCEPNVIIV